MQYEIFTEKGGWFSLYFYMYLEITEEFNSNSLLIFQKGNQLHLHPRKRGPMRMKLKFLNQKDPIFVGSQSPWWMSRWLNGGGSSPRQLSSGTQPSSLRPRIQIHCWQASWGTVYHTGKMATCQIHVKLVHVNVLKEMLLMINFMRNSV